MNDLNGFIYQPYRTHLGFAIFTIIMAVFSFVVFGFSFSQIGFHTLFLFVSGLMFLLLTKTLYNSSKIIIVFDDVGLLIFNDKHSKYRQFNWAYFSNVYYTTNFKGNLFAVLTSNAKTETEIKKLASRSANSSKLCIDDAVIISFDPLSKDVFLKELIESHQLGQDKTGEDT